MVSLRLSIPAEAPRATAPLGDAAPAPTPSLQTLSGTFILPEDAAQGASAGSLDGRTPGSALSLTDDAGGRVALAGASIVRGPAPLDYETATSHSFTVRETLASASNSPRDTVLTLTVTNVFEAPALAALSLSAAMLAEGAPQGTAVGIIESRTAGSSLALIDDAGGQFQLNGLTIEAGPTATDHGMATSHAITIRETLADSPNSPRETVLTITIAEAAEPEPPAEAITAMLMGQSELEHLLAPTAFNKQIPMPLPGDGNLIVFTQNGAGVPPVRTVVNADSVAAGQVNPAMAAVSALLDHVTPGTLYALGDGAVAGTSRRDLSDDSSNATDNRLWGDFASVASAIESEFGEVGNLIECWYNSDAAFVGNMPANFWPFYFGAHADGSPFALGDTVNGRQVDHCLYDASAAPSVKGRGIFARDVTDWHVLTPMPFLDAPVAPEPELANFSANGARLSEPVRANLHALTGNSLARSVNLRVGPSAHLCQFGGAGGEIHPNVAAPDGQVLMAWPIAVALLRASGMAIGEPSIVGTEGPADGSYVDIWVDLPNGGELTTLAALRGSEYAGSAPHQQDVTGFEITRAGGARRPVFRPDQTSRPASHRGTATIVDAGSGNPRRGRIRVTPEQPFAFGDTVSFLRGQATASLLEPRDFDLYPWFPIEHVPALYDAAATYPCEGLAVRPYQADLTAPVEAPAFQGRGVYLDGESYYASTTISAAASDSGLLLLWFRNDDAEWNAVRRTLLQLRVSFNIRLDLYTSNAGRLALRLYNDVSNLDSFHAAQPGDIQFQTGAWYHLLIGWGPGGARVLVNGAQVMELTFADVTMAGETISRIGIGAEVTGGTPWKGDLGHFYINLTETLDLSDPADVAKFIADGTPVDLGANGQLPTGNAPAFYYDGDAPAWANQGTAGNIPLTGELTASEAVPGMTG